MNLFKEIRNKRKKFESGFILMVKKASKADTCCLCGKKISSPCNSHVVPQFILKNIAENGKVSYGYTMVLFEIGGLDKITGIKNAKTFRLICRECDKLRFKDYEDLNNLKNYDELSLIEKSKILCEIAIKNHLSHINMKHGILVERNILTKGKLREFEEKGEFSFERIEINSHFYHIDRLVKMIKSRENIFEVLFDIKLNYKTNIATQTTINFVYDINGNRIFKSDRKEYDKNLQWFHLVIFPYENNTRVLFFTEKNNTRKEFINQFNVLTNDEKLHFLFIALISNDEQFYISPSLADKMMKDKKLRKLYVKTEKNVKNTVKMKNYKQYNNYLLDK